MNENSSARPEIRKIRRLLRETAKLARDASLTGSLAKGAAGTVRQFNHWLSYLEDESAVPHGIFEKLPDDASFDDIGVAASLLATYLDDDEEPQPRKGGPGMGHGNTIHIGGPGLRDLRELRELGQIIRENLPHWVKGREVIVGAACAEDEEREARTFEEVEARLAQVSAQVEVTADQLRRGEIDDEQRAELSEQLARFSKQQARLVRRRAALRERREAHI